MAVLGAIGVHVGTSDGWVWRNPNAMTATEIADGKQRRFNLVQAGCQITGLENRTLCKVERPAQILVFGDSHEVEGYNAMAAIYGGDPAVNLISFGAFNGCDVQFKASVPFSTVDGCSARVALLNDARFVGSLKGLVFSQNKPFDDSAADLWRVIRHLKRMNEDLPVAVLGGFINTNRDCTELYSEFHTFNACKGLPTSSSMRSRNESTGCFPLTCLGSSTCTSTRWDCCAVTARSTPVSSRRVVSRLFTTCTICP